MAFTLKIKNKSFFLHKQINFSEILKNCNLKFGSDNEFYVLQPEKIKNNTTILYNQSKIGRGIFFDNSKCSKGIVTVSINIPTTETEITDLFNVVQEIQRQFKKVEIFCIEENREYTLIDLLNEKQRLTQFCIKSLNDFCNNPQYVSYMFTLAMWPLTLSREQVHEFALTDNLNKFEDLIHKKQAIDAYYATPNLFENKNTNKIMACYVLTEECESIFPIKGSNFLNLDNIKIDEVFIRFYIFSEERMIDGFFNYDKFINEILSMNPNMFDDDHILIPSLNKNEIESIIEKISD